MTATPSPAHASTGTPSDWVVRWADRIPPGAEVLDVACGSGRHALWLAARGWRVTGVDRDAEALASLSRSAASMACTEAGGSVRTVCADLEGEGGPWPLPGQTFAAVVVTNYLWRDLFPALVQAVAPGGLLIYETFARGHERYGRPTRPAFLLEPGELLARCVPLTVVAFEDGLLSDPLRRIQRIVARRPCPGEGEGAVHLGPG